MPPLKSTKDITILQNLWSPHNTALKAEPTVNFSVVQAKHINIITQF